jgi:RimJ/RimL family protein N-acetyltransferase
MDLNLLRGNLVRLAALERADAGTLARWSEDTTYMRLQDTQAALPRTHAQVTAELEQLNDGHNAIAFAIRTVSDDVLIGTVGFYEIEWSNDAAWLGIGIGERSDWGKGYGTEALWLALRYAFDELNFHRLTVTVIANNARAIALYERAGFRREGIFREFGLRDGQRYDMLLYGLLRPEWKAVQAGE